MPSLFFSLNTNHSSSRKSQLQLGEALIQYQFITIYSFLHCPIFKVKVYSVLKGKKLLLWHILSRNGTTVQSHDETHLQMWSNANGNNYMAMGFTYCDCFGLIKETSVEPIRTWEKKHKPPKRKAWTVWEWNPWPSRCEAQMLATQSPCHHLPLTQQLWEQNIQLLPE